MNSAALLAAVHHTWKPKLPPFPEQDKFVNDPSQFLSAQCTRRAGKTNALALKFINTMKKHPNSLSRYIALTRDSARDIMWPVLMDMNERLELHADMTESKLTMTMPNGAKLRLFGADMKNFIRRLKGAKSPAVAIDEAQDFGDHLETLIDDVLTPTIADYEDSWLAVTGTPGPIPRGVFYNITREGIGDFSKHEWTVYQNPYLPNAHKFVADLKARKKWDDNNPTYLREWQNKWVLDLESLLIRYDAAIADYGTLTPQKYTYIMGIDLGFNDADALAVLAWSDADPTTYLIEEVIAHKQGLTELVAQIQLLQSKYDIAKLVIDEGGLGKKLAEELRRRHHIPVQAAEKSRKMENVAFLNDALRTGKFKAKSQSRFAQDSYSLQIDHEKTTPDKIVVKKGFHSDIIDAVLYGFKESPAFSYQAPKIKPGYKTPKWFEEEVSEMERAAEEHFEKLRLEESSGIDGETL